jgi:hypothetical protein
MTRIACLLLAFLAATAPVTAVTPVRADPGPPSVAHIVEAFAKQGIRLTVAEAAVVRPNLLLALREAAAHGIGNSKVDFAAVEIAQDLKLDTSAGSSTVRNVSGAVRWLHERGHSGGPKITPAPATPEWDRYYQDTLNLWNDQAFMSQVQAKGFHPVKISWEDIGRHENSVWGDRISDVGIWVRRDESDPQSAQLALSVRRDSNFRDKVLMVPSAAIKIHQRVNGRTVEKTLPQRLAELGLTSPSRDRNVIVSNQFAIVPVPARGMHGAWPDGVPPRAAFTFSIFPYGSTNAVITDVIEGSHDAIVGPGAHQLLFAEVEGQKAPFTASRAEDRQDLLRLERELKAQGMDVDVQRYYLIQVPLRRDASVQLSNMGTPPFGRPGVLYETMNAQGAVLSATPAPAPNAPAPKAQVSKDDADSEKKREDKAGLARVAIGHGDPEGPYSRGSGTRGARADEPVRVTVVYFVTPVGKVTARDMQTFTAAFERWDKEAIWGGSFVTKETF